MHTVFPLVTNRIHDTRIGGVAIYANKYGRIRKGHYKCRIMTTKEIVTLVNGITLSTDDDDDAFVAIIHLGPGESEVGNVEAEDLLDETVNSLNIALLAISQVDGNVLECQNLAGNDNDYPQV